MLNIRTLVVFVATLSVQGMGQNLFPILGGQRAGTSIFTFLKIGVSARAVGMGEAVVALNQDAGSLFYNPGTIPQLSQMEFSASRIQWPAEINYDFFGFTSRVYKRHYLGLSMGMLHMPPMEETTEYRPHGTGNYFTFQDRFIGLTYGTRMTDRFSFGLTLKHVQEDMAGLKMSTVMLDMGTFYWTGFKSLRFSAALSNFGTQAKPSGSFENRILDKDTGEETMIQSDFEEFSPPTIFRIGSAIDIIESDWQALTVALQLNHPVDNAEYIVMGVEYLVLGTLTLRTGYKFNKDEENISFGLGLYIPVGSLKLRVDYAYTNFLHLSDPVRLSMGLSL